MKKRALSLILASFAAAALIGGCGAESYGSIIILDGGGKPAEKTSLTVYGHRTDRYSLGVIESALQGYMSVGTTAASYEGAAERKYWKALDTRFKTDNLDDVFMTDRDRVLAMTENNALADLSGAVNVSLFNEFARSQLYADDGKIYAVPTCISTYGLYVNYGLLEKHCKSVPRNLAEFTSVCGYFAEDGITPLVCNNSSSLRSLILAKGMYETYARSDTDAEIAKFNADPSLLSQPLGAGVDFVYGMIENGWIDLNETAGTEYISGDLKLFAAGERPFMITAGWASTYLKETLEAGGKSLSYGVHAYPVLDSSSVLVAQTDTLISVKRGGNENEAKRLASVMTAPETLYGLSERQSRFTVLKGQTQISADSTVIPSASYLVKGKYVIGSDVNLTVPLDGILDECCGLIISGESAEAVKAYLEDILGGYKAGGR